MKPILFFYVFCFFNFSLFAQDRPNDLAIIKSIDDTYYSPNYLDASEEALPPGHLRSLTQKIFKFKFTPMTDSKIRDLFEKLSRHPKARMKKPQGLCSQRRAYIQNYLKKMDITSGRILVRCPSKNGRLRVRDQVSGRNYTYSNYHDANIVTIGTNSGYEFRVLDLQFQDSPISLNQYLTEIERYQKIRPSIKKGPDKGVCYWNVATPYLSY